MIVHLATRVPGWRAQRLGDVNDQRDSQPTVIRPLLASHVRATVITHHDHDCVVGQTVILQLLQEDERIHPDENIDLVVRAVDDVIYENMQQEDEIDAEVAALVEQNVNEIRAMEMDVGALRNKIKREIARKRNFVI